MFDHIEDHGSFRKNLEAFIKRDFLTTQHAALIESVVDAGHAAIHRAHFPNPSDIAACVHAVKHLMEGVYVLKPKLDVVSANTPPRTK